MRTFKNEKGNWKDAEKLVKEINSYAEIVDSLAKDLVKANKKLLEMALEAYKTAPEIDCLFYDSPLSPSRQSLNLRLYLKKLGFDGIRDVVVNNYDISDFSECVKDGGRWLMKLKPNKQEK